MCCSVLKKLSILISVLFLAISLYPNKSYAAWEGAWFGTKVHTEVTKYFAASNRLLGDTKKSGKGLPKLPNEKLQKPDLLIEYYNDTTSASIYEIKPYSNYTSFSKRNLATDQLEGYVNQYNKYPTLNGNRRAGKGTLWNPAGTAILVPGSGEFAVLFTNYSQNPGLIFYNKIKANPPKSNYYTVPYVIKDAENKDYTVYAKDIKNGLVIAASVATGVIVVGLVVAGVLTFGAALVSASAITAAVVLASNGIRYVPGANEILDASID